MRQPEFTPRVWHSEDGKTTFKMDKYGFTDICPGPNSQLMKFLTGKLSQKENDFLIFNKKNIWNKFQHTHWAYKPTDK